MSKQEKPNNKVISLASRLYKNQLDIFFLAPSERKYSQAIDFYDSIPKYVYRKNSKHKILSDDTKYPHLLKTVNRAFKYKDKQSKKETEYIVSIHPARIKQKDPKTGKPVYSEHYPAAKEENIFDALFKMAISEKGTDNDYNSAIENDLICYYFTLGGLQRELAKYAHTYSIKEIRISLQILASASHDIIETGALSIKREGFGEKYLSVRLVSIEEWRDDPDARCRVEFNSMITQAVKNGQYRLYNYDLSMNYDKTVAKYLQKRMQRNWLHAEYGIGNWSINASTIIEEVLEANVDESESISNKAKTKTKKPKTTRFMDRMRVIIKSLEELKTVGIEMFPDSQNARIEKTISKYEISYVYDHFRKNKVIDARITFYPHPAFVGFMKKANYRQKESRKAIENNK